MNILYLHSHDTGRYIQPYGHAIPTPNLQRFAEQGVLFRQAFCANPTCSASRACLLTGRYAHSNGMLGLAHRGPCRIKDYQWHLANFLSGQGYATALSGMQHEVDGADRQVLGYERILSDNPPATDDPLSRNEWIAGRAADYLAATDRSKPFFLSCGFNLTHRTGQGVQWHNGPESPTGEPRYVRPPAPLPDLPEIRRDFADFIVAAGRLDRCMGQVLDALQVAGLAEQTLVIVTTDHGIAYPHMKCNLTDHGTGVMLMLRGPQGLGGGRVVDGLVSHVDLFPTICELAGLPAPDWLQGRSLLPLAAGQVDAIRDEVFSEVNWHAALEPMRTVRTARYRYIRRFNPRPGPVLANCDDSPSKNALRAAGWDTIPQPAEALYDLYFDPNEACNRAEDPACESVLTDLRARLDRWMHDTGDPLLTGRLTPWPGMLVNPPDDESPQLPMSPAEVFTL